MRASLNIRYYMYVCLCMYVLNVVSLKKTTYLLSRAFCLPLSDLASVNAIKQTGSENGLFLPAFYKIQLFKFTKANIENHILYFVTEKKSNFLLRPFVVVLFEEQCRSASNESSLLESFTEYTNILDINCLVNILICGGVLMPMYCPGNKIVFNWQMLPRNSLLLRK